MPLNGSACIRGIHFDLHTTSYCGGGSRPGEKFIVIRGGHPIVRKNDFSCYPATQWWRYSVYLLNVDCRECSVYIQCFDKPALPGYGFTVGFSTEKKKIKFN